MHFSCLSQTSSQGHFWRAKAPIYAQQSALGRVHACLWRPVLHRSVHLSVSCRLPISQGGRYLRPTQNQSENRCFVWTVFGFDVWLTLERDGRDKRGGRDGRDKSDKKDKRDRRDGRDGQDRRDKQDVRDGRSQTGRNETGRDGMGRDGRDGTDGRTGREGRHGTGGTNGTGGDGTEDGTERRGRTERAGHGEDGGDEGDGIRFLEDLIRNASDMPKETPTDRTEPADRNSRITFH